MNCNFKTKLSAGGRDGQEGAAGMRSMLAAALALLMPLIGCDDSTEQQEELPADVQSTSRSAARTLEAKLRRFECSDEKCWLEVELPDSRVVSGVCEAAVCVQWLDNGARLPLDLVGRRVRIGLRRTRIFIGSDEDPMEAEEFRRIRLLE